MLEVSVSDSVVNKPRENIAYSAEIKSKCKFDSASSMKFFPRGAVWKPKYIDYRGCDIEL